MPIEMCAAPRHAIYKCLNISFWFECDDYIEQTIGRDFGTITTTTTSKCAVRSSLGLYNNFLYDHSAECAKDTGCVGCILLLI